MNKKKKIESIKNEYEWKIKESKRRYEDELKYINEYNQSRIEEMRREYQDRLNQENERKKQK